MPDSNDNRNASSEKKGFAPLCPPTFCQLRRIYIVMIIRAHQVLYSAVHNNIFLVTRAEKQNVENVPEPIKASQGSFTLEFSPKESGLLSLVQFSTQPRYLGYIILYVSMTSLLEHTIEQPTKCRFLPKKNVSQ